MNKMTIRENLTPAQVLEIVLREREKGNWVSTNRLHSQLVEITITETVPTLPPSELALQQHHTFLVRSKNS